MSAPVTSDGQVADLAELVEQLTAQIKDGTPVDLEALAREHPGHADELRRLLPAVQMMADLSIPRAADGGAPLGELGDFRIVREVGRGGMGIVYEAEQISLNRNVALKVLPFAATLDAKQLQRFKNEARAAASLRHEHIVHVYGVGCERGIHYYAMEFIDGLSLAQIIARLPADGSASRWRERPLGETVTYAPIPPAAAQSVLECEAPTAPVAALSTDLTGPRDRGFYRAAARLVADAADALEHAHSLGIVHRDVKPGNLLVDSAGKVYVADFGLARFRSDADLTMTGDLLGTLRYMSPEQAFARHGLVDHRTDVYSLGATLYELLTLRPAMEGTDKQEVLRKIAFDEPKAPRSVDRTIPEELETITLKALAKEPEERYATAGDLAEDLRRWLRDQTIKAKPPTLRQRLVKWGRRHPSLVGATVVVLGLAVAGLAVSNVLIGRARQDAIAAAKGADLVVNDMYVSVAEEWLRDQPALEQKQREFVQKALDYYEGRVRVQQDKPDLLAAVGLSLYRIAVIHDRLGDLKKGGDAYTRASAIFGTLAEWHPSNADYRYWQAHSLAEHGELCDRLGEGQDAENLARQAFKLFQQAAIEFPNDIHIRAGLADCCLVLGSVNFVPGPRMNLPYKPDYTSPRRMKECISLLRNALELYPQVIEKEPENSDPRWRFYRAKKILSQMSDVPIAERKRLSQESVAGFEALSKKFRGQHRPRTELCEALGWRGKLLRDEGRAKDSEKAHRRAVAIADQLVNDYPTVPYYPLLKATANIELGQLLAWTDRLDDAEPLLTGAIATLKKTPDGLVPQFQPWAEEATCYSALGMAYDRDGRLAEADWAYERALTLYLRLARWNQYSATWQQLGLTCQQLSYLRARNGQTESGIEAHLQCVALWKGLVKLHPSSVFVRRCHAWSLNNMGVFLQWSGLFDEADRAYGAAQEVHIELENSQLINPASQEYWEPVVRERWPWSQRNRSWAHAKADRLDRAVDAARQLVEWFARPVKEFQPGTAAQRTALASATQDEGRFLHRIGRVDKSIESYRDATAQLDKLAEDYPSEPQRDTDRVAARMQLAHVQQRAGNAVEANRVADEAVEIQRKLSSSGELEHQRRLAELLSEQGTVLWQTGRRAEGLSACGQAVEIMRKLVVRSRTAGMRRSLEASLALVTARHAYLLEDFGPLAEAEAAYGQVVSLRRRIALGVVRGVATGRSPWVMATYHDVNARIAWVRSLIELAQFHLRRGQTGHAACRFSRAHTVLEDLVADYPADPVAQNQLAWFLVTVPVESLRDPSRALWVAKKAVALDENRITVETLGMAQYRNGDFAAAAASLEVANRLHHSAPDPAVLFFRAMAHWRLGHQEAARRHYDEGVRWLEPPYYGSDGYVLREDAAAVLGGK